MYIEVPGVARFHYYVFGEGKIPLFCFHGFGYTGEQFAILEPSLGKKYQLVCFDLPFHGLTEVIDTSLIEKGFEKEHFCELITAYCQLHNVNQFSVAGFSIGSKVAVLLAAHFSAKLKELYLFAPDGIEKSWLYNFATRTLIGKALFSYFVRSNTLMPRVRNLMVGLHLVTKKVGDFALANMATATRRQLVYATWMGFRKLRTNKKELAQLLNENGVFCLIFVGEKDQIIRSKAIKAFSDTLQHTQFINLPYGHQLLSYAAINTYINQQL